MTGITISTKQVEIANRLTKSKAAAETGIEEESQPDSEGFLSIGKGKVKFIELDAEKMGDFFAEQGSSFDAVWITEALSHFPNKQLFFQNAQKVLKPSGKLVLADWFKNEGLSEKQFVADIKPIEGKPRCVSSHKSSRDALLTSLDGMLLPPLCTQAGYVKYAEDAGLRTISEPKDISKDVSKTWFVDCHFQDKDSLANLMKTGISHGHLYRTHRFGRLHSAKVGMALPFCSHSAQCDAGTLTEPSVMP